MPFSNTKNELKVRARVESSEAEAGGLLELKSWRAAWAT
jgi:hypothetical protein